MSSYRRILRISWEDMVTNEKTVGKMRKDIIKIRKLKYQGHVMMGKNMYYYRMLCRETYRKIEAGEER